MAPNAPKQNQNETGPSTGALAIETAERAGSAASGAFRNVASELAARRGLRVALIGIGLIVLGVYLGADSALSVPLIVLGGVLAAGGILGPRLSGRFAVEFGASGTVIDFHTAVAPPGAVASERNRTLPTPVSTAEVAVRDAEVVESTGETVEIDVGELETLIRAAEERAAGDPSDPR